jgi:DNA-binding MarR family transcriptional regulator
MGSAARLVVEQSHASLLIDRLANADLVRRIVDGEDRRILLPLGSGRLRFSSSHRKNFTTLSTSSQVL